MVTYHNTAEVQITTEIIYITTSQELISEIQLRPLMYVYTLVS